MSKGRFFRQLVELKSSFSNAAELPFSDVLSEKRIGVLLEELNVVYRERIYTPCVTLWIFLWQVLSVDSCCRAAVARFVAFRVAQGLPPCSTETTSYCAARQRLPERLVSRLARETGKQMQEQALECWRFQGRCVKVVDGSTVSMPDTKENEKEFGKPGNQLGKSGFPLARILVIFCLATGAVLEAAIGPYRGKKSGELSLWRSLHHTLKAGDLVLGDRLFCTYFDMVRLVQRGVDVVFRQHAHRQSDFRRGKKLGKEEHVVVWSKPSRRPDWMSKKEFQKLPAEWLVRELRIRVMIPGFRVHSLIVVTTLTDPDQFSKDDLANLFRQRWNAELNLRSIKTVLQMDVLRCLTPEMVRKEIWMHLLGYNLVRSLMCAAAQEHKTQPRHISFKGALQVLTAFQPSLVTTNRQSLEKLCNIVILAVSQHQVGNRPNRYEPRKRKREPKPYPRMKLSRHEERKHCL